MEKFLARESLQTTGEESRAALVGLVKLTLDRAWRGV